MNWKSFIVLLSLPLWFGCGFSEARIKKDKEAVGHYKLGISYLNDNFLQKAYIEFQKAVEMDPQNKDAYYALGHVYFQQENYAEAAGSFQKAISIDSKYSDAHNYLGKVYEVQGNQDKAIQEYQEALKNQQ